MSWDSPEVGHSRSNAFWRLLIWATRDQSCGIQQIDVACKPLCKESVYGFCDKALPASFFVVLLLRPSVSAFDAAVATVPEVFLPVPD